MTIKLSRRQWIKIAGFSMGAVALGPSLLLPRDKTELESDSLKDMLISKPYLENYLQGELIYENPLQGPKDVKNFVLEGEAKLSFPDGRLRMENQLDPSLGQKSNFVYWCPEDFPDEVAISWNFWPLQEPGLCIFFFSARGKNGEDIFDPSLAGRQGIYKQYHHGDINALHVSYFRRRYRSERAFHLCNLRKSYGSHMVVQGADPIPSISDAANPYHIRLVKLENTVNFYINELQVLSWQDDGNTYGTVLGGGKIGFRQMAPLVAEYLNLRVCKVEKRRRK